MPEFLLPRWPAPRAVRAAVTTRAGGVSQGPYAAFNLAGHVGDDPVAVVENRRRLREALALPAEPLWLEQVHGCAVAECGRDLAGARADAAFAEGPGAVCAVLTADCLPLLLCNRSGSRVAAAHAGWRGLAEGVIEAALGRFPDPPAELLAWLGPAIGPAAFEVGAEVRAAFLAQRPADAEAFRPAPPKLVPPSRLQADTWLANLYRLAYNRLLAHGVGWIGGGEHCTLSDPDRFFSYRRDGTTGRMASLIWIEVPHE
jgi:polyphenol oxidase